MNGNDLCAIRDRLGGGNAGIARVLGYQDDGRGVIFWASGVLKWLRYGEKPLPPVVVAALSWALLDVDLASRVARGEIRFPPPPGAMPAERAAFTRARRRGA